MTHIYKFEKEKFNGQWITLLFLLDDGNIRGGFNESVRDDNPDFNLNEFHIKNFTEMFEKGLVYVGGNNETHVHNPYNHSNHNNHTVTDIMSNSLESNTPINLPEFQETDKFKVNRNVDNN